MAQKAYGGVSNVARNGIKLYGGVNNIARNIIKGYVGDENGISRQFWGSYVKKQYKLVLNNSYEAGNYYNLTKGDCLTALKYALQEWVWLNKDRVHPMLIHYVEEYEGQVISDFLSKYNDEDEIDIRIYSPLQSSGVDKRSVYIYIYLVNSDRTNAYISNAGYNPFVSNGAELGYYRAITDLIAFADYNQKFQININYSGGYTFIYPTTTMTQYNVVGTRLLFNENSPGERDIAIYTSNLGVHFDEIVYPEDYWLEWDFSGDGSAKYFDTQRGIYFGKVTNGVFADGYLKMTEGWWTPPYWVLNLLGHCSVKYEFEGSITIGDTSEHRPIFKQNNNYGLFFRNTGYWGFYDAAWLMSENDSPSIFYDGHVEFTMAFDNFLEVPRITFPNQSYEDMHPVVTFGGAATNQIAVWNIRRLRITKIPIDYSNIVYYRDEFYLSPSGLDVQFNNVKSDNYSDFVEYYGTNKCLIYNETNITANWTMDNRTLVNIPSYNIRFNVPSNDSGLHRLYIPVNSLTGYTRLKAVIGRQSSAGAANHRVGFGVAYIDDNDVLQTEGLTDLSLISNRYSRFYFDITFSKIDYVYCEAKGATATTHFKLLQFV